jgi:hypothetical protein
VSHDPTRTLETHGLTAYEAGQMREAAEYAAVRSAELLPAPLPPRQVLVNGQRPLPGSDAVYVSPAVAFWPYSVMVRLTTSGAAGSRNVALEYRDGNGARYSVAGASVTMPAGSVQSFCWHHAAGSPTWAVEDAAIAPLAPQWVEPPNVLAVKVWNGDVADQLDNFRLSIYQAS